MTAVVFETPGLIDMRAFTVMGAHAKPNTDAPIGYFGTGLKYALAVLVRSGAEPIVWVGRDRFRFSKVQSSFRGAPLETIKMSRLRDGNQRETSYEMPFTTAMGKNWELWMAYREMASNTFDEGGKIVTINRPENFDLMYGGPRDGWTYIVVDLDAFVDVHVERDTVFLKDGLRTGTGIQVLPGPSEALWWRGMRVLDLPKPSIFTYNVLDPITLTEDRTLKYEAEARWAIAKWVVNGATADEAEKVLKAKGDNWETILDFPHWAMPEPSPAFREVLNERRGNPPAKTASTAVPEAGPQVSGQISRAAWTYFAPIARRERPCRAIVIERPWRLTDEHPRPWRVNGMEVQDAAGNAVFAAPDGYYDEWPRTAEAIINRVNIGLGGTMKPSTTAPESVNEPTENSQAEPLESEDTAPAADEEIPF